MGNKQTKHKISPNTVKLIEPTKIIKTKFVMGIIDPQNDFFRGGALEISNANDIIAPINKLRFILFDYMETFISQDFHPENHVSFASTHNEPQFSTIQLELTMNNNKVVTVNQTLWPTHCVQGTFGSLFHKDLVILKRDRIFQKGTKVNVESYSAFGDEFANSYENTGLHLWLLHRKITDIVLVGLATDYCIFNTAKDAIRLGYRVHIIMSCIQGVEHNTTTKALSELKSHKVIFYNDVEDFCNTNQNLIEKNC